MDLVNDSRIIETLEDGRQVEWTIALTPEQVRRLAREGWTTPKPEGIRGRAAACYRMVSA